MLFLAHQQGMGAGQSVTIDGSATQSLPNQYDVLTVVSDNTNSQWWILHPIIMFIISLWS